ncbi:substrate-binding protein [Fodinibius salinus]|uniref:Substrate-binding protein n=1 Tax=Fodinibius salinus TaxID=860790 RepID=A0A5D3YII7_9BACT|nr:helical backbone metal receptor [Fodinibius salinus]TYP93375.1 substrate-binding protein [Fodinibius salinus]
MAKKKQIISLVPSLTELIIDMGLGNQLVGRTRFCVHPQEAIQDIPIVGGTKNPRIDKIHDISPDYIIANKEENRPEDIKNLQDDAEIILTDISTIEEALSAIEEIGSIFDVSQKAKKLISQIHQKLEERPDTPPLDTIYMIWKDPWMTIGGDTYIHDVLSHWNLNNIFGNQCRYPTFDLQDLQSYEPELILLSSEPYPFKEKHIVQVEEKCPHARVLRVEGEWFSWYGSRMKHAFGRLNGWRQTIAN